MARLNTMPEPMRSHLAGLPCPAFDTRLAPGLLFLCQYNLADCSGAQSMMALETHAFSLYKNKLTPLRF